MIIVKMSLFAVCCAATSLVWAEPVGKNAAQLIASKYLANPQLQTIKVHTRTTETDAQAVYYLFTNTIDNRFVIVSGESRLNELVGYGTLSSANGTKPVSEEFKEMLRRYEHVVAAVRAEKAQVPTVSLPAKREVQSLLTCHWEQNYLFNQKTPKQSGVNTPTESKK